MHLLHCAYWTACVSVVVLWRHVWHYVAHTDLHVELYRYCAYSSACVPRSDHPRKFFFSQRVVNGWKCSGRSCECRVRKQLQKCLRPLSSRYVRQKLISLPVHQHTSTSTSPRLTVFKVYVVQRLAATVLLAEHFCHIFINSTPHNVTVIKCENCSLN